MVPQLLLVGAGVLLIYGVTSFMHHEHDLAHEHGQHAIGRQTTGIDRGAVAAGGRPFPVHAQELP